MSAKIPPVDPGGAPLLREGMVTPGYFEVIVLEFDLPAEPAADANAAP